jgi:transcriptional regulator with XRE-family HTH domain
MTNVDHTLLHRRDRRELPIFARLLRQRMRGLGMSRRELAMRAGISTTSLHEYLGAKRRPWAQSLDKLCLVLGDELRSVFGERCRGRRLIPFAAMQVGTTDQVRVDMHVVMSWRRVAELTAWCRQAGINLDRVRPA